jgi:hypothetical protein
MIYIHQQMMKRSLISFTKQTSAVHSSDISQLDLSHHNTQQQLLQTNTTTPDDDAGQTDN